MVTVRAFFTPAEAALAKSLLDDHDILCSLADENSYLYGVAPLAIIALLVSLPGILLLTQEHDLILFASTYRLARGDFTVTSPTNAHWMGAAVIGLALFLVFLFFYVRRDIATDAETRAER